MGTMERLRAGVRESFPEIASITDQALREKVVEAWALALAETEFERVESIPSSAVPDSPRLVRATQADHLRGVTRMALAMAEQLEAVLGPCGIDRDVLIAAALCHDVGKPFEYSRANQERWQANPARAGWPAIRHPVYGAHIALLAGLPESVVHAAGAHSAEGENVARSLENTIIHFADKAFWAVAARANLLTQDD